MCRDPSDMTQAFRQQLTTMKSRLQKKNYKIKNIIKDKSIMFQDACQIDIIGREQCHCIGLQHVKAIRIRKFVHTSTKYNSNTGNMILLCKNNCSKFF
uniref:Uncharacterized protein n=1 Tax=Strigamia maritima TaxID=126957 RepID=T1J5M4_STRMM